MHCFWCGDAIWQKERYVNRGDDATWDHVTPKGVGGSNAPSNMVMACRWCNLERGRIVSFYCFHLELVKRINTERPSESLVRSIRKYNEQVRDILRLAALWETVETELLGYSPSAAMRFPLHMTCFKARKKNHGNFVKMCHDEQTG